MESNVRNKYVEKQSRKNKTKQNGGEAKNINKILLIRFYYRDAKQGTKSVMHILCSIAVRHDRTRARCLRKERNSV